MEESGEVKEGFLCPMCMKDLGTQSLLQSHFVEVHSFDGDATKGQNIKGMFDKAKRKILGKADETPEQVTWGRRAEVQMSATGKQLDFSYWEPQDIGFSRDLTREFRNARSQTIDDGKIEINTILIRLEKILKASTDTKDSQWNSTKKAKERSLVPWISDSDVKVCFGCKRLFTVARRKHHCRLCGQVICRNCSEFLPRISAGILCTLDGVQYSNLDFSKHEVDEQDALRICCGCYELLMRHHKFRKEKEKKIPLVKLYERLTVLMSEADLLLPDFNKMAESLSLGDSRYSYDEVVKTRLKLLKMYEALELLSKKVLALASESTDNDPDNNPKQGMQSQKLQRGIHAFVTHYLQSNMFTLKSIPSEDEFATLQAERLGLLRRRAEREKAQLERAMKERAMMHKEVLRKERDSRNNSPLPCRREISQNRNLESDTLLEQINNVKEYLRKAEENGQFEEISALESNLHELQIEYNKQTGR